MLERRWKLPASSRYYLLGEIKRLVLRRIQAIKHAMVEISGILKTGQTEESGDFATGKAETFLR